MSAVVADSGGEEDGSGIANDKVGEWFEPLQEKGTHIKFHWNEEHGWCEGRVTKPMRKILTKTQIKWVVTVHFDDGETNTVNFLKSEEHRWRFLSSPVPTTTNSSSSNVVASKNVPKKARNPTSQKRTQKESSSVKESDGPKTTKRTKKTASKAAKKTPTKSDASSSSVSDKVSKRMPFQALDQNQGEPPIKELDKTFVDTKPVLQDTPCENNMSKDAIPEEEKTISDSTVEDTLDPV
eukprot:scaffold158464_cov49-Attheya_sp.AAC.4